MPVYFVKATARNLYTRSGYKDKNNISIMSGSDAHLYS